MSSEAPTPPTPQAQVAFLQNLQRILDEGSFVATYKFALVHALADLAVERGDGSGAPLTLPTRDIAERFIHLYWRQVVPFPGAEEAGLLAQNTGRQAAIVNRVAEARVRYGDSIGTLEDDPVAWRRLVQPYPQDQRVRAGRAGRPAQLPLRHTPPVAGGRPAHPGRRPGGAVLLLREAGSPARPARRPLHSVVAVPHRPGAQLRPRRQPL